jgi:hypothetical protein
MENLTGLYPVTYLGMNETARVWVVTIDNVVKVERVGS